MNQETFDSLAQIWQNDFHIQMSSKAGKVLEHPAFQRIIDEGPSVVPLIFKALEKEYDHAWPMALFILIGSSPVKLENRGRIAEIRKDWLAWGRQNGYLK